MSGWNGFNNLDLTNVEADNFAPLEEGRHSVKCSKAELVTGQNGKDKRLVVDLDEVTGAGSIRVGFNVHHTTSAKAQEIALRQLKAFLLHGGHPTPDNPGDIKSLVGLKCDIYVAKGKPYARRNDDGTSTTVQRNEVKRFMPSDGERSRPTDGDGASSGGGHVKRDIDDEIPF